MDRVGQVLDNKYKLVRLLGEGGMGAVYEAHHTVIGRRCAVKFLLAEIAQSPEAVKRFVREAQAASAIGHPNVIDIYDFGVADDGVPYLVMEFLEGVSLADELEQRKKLPPLEAVEILCQTLAALGVAHRRGVVHRDLKPDNLYLIRVQGAQTRVKILDFGISKLSNPGKPEERMTCTGAVLGTPYYMAPEQARGDRDVDHRLDLWAIGVILYEALTGAVPFIGDNYNQLLVKILGDPIRPPRELDPAIPPELDAIVLRAMERDRTLRYQSAEEMLGDLLALLDDTARARVGVSPDTLPPPTTHRTRPASPITMTPHGQAMEGTASPRRNRWMLPAAAVAGLAVLVVGLVLWAPWKKGAEAPAEPAPAAAAALPPDAGAPADAAAAKVAPAVVPAAVAAQDVAVAVVGAADAGPVAAAVVDAAPEVAPPAGQAVTVALQNAPDGAEVLWDGVKVETVPFRVKQSAVAVRLQVRATGYAPYESLVTPDHDVTVAVDMRRTGRAEGTRPPHNAGPAATTGPTGPTAPPPGPGGDMREGGRGTSMATSFQ